MISAGLRLLRAALDALLTGVSGLFSALLSNRSVAVITLACCALLAVAPWLRPPVSRDYRGVHIPWGETSSPTFLPEVANETPRPWRWDSLAVPILAVIAVGAIVVLMRPRWTGNVFGLVLAMSLPAIAVSMWNYPTLIESFDSEMRDRALLRAVFRQHSEHMLSAGTPDRLATLGNKATRDDLLAMEEHPLASPLRYTVFGVWLVGVALVATAVAQPGSWPRRTGIAGLWTLAGLLLALAATWPRLLAEYHWTRADSLERANQFAEAELSLDAIQTAMPAMEHTSRYWLARGRLAYRQQQRENEYQAYFLAYQSILGGDLDRARALVEPHVVGAGGSIVERDLLAAILAQRAAEYIADAKFSAAELAWSEAVAVAPWKTSYWIGQSAAQLAAAPHRAQEIEAQISSRLAQVGDRMVCSDFYSLVGDAHFAGGSFDQARAMYDLAINWFHLPKYTNVHAQEGRLGM